MLRVGFSVVVAAVVGVSLTGCSSALSSNSSSEQLQALKFESGPAGRRDPHQQRPDVHYALRTVGAVARAAGDHHQERLPAANRPNHPGPAVGPLVLGESATNSHPIRSTSCSIRRRSRSATRDRFPERTLPRQGRRLMQLPAPSHRRHRRRSHQSSAPSKQ